MTAADANDLLFQIALTLVPNVGAVQAKILVEKYGDAEQIFKVKKQELECMEGIGEVRAKSIKAFTDFSRAEEEILFLQKHHIDAFFLSHEKYPKRLLNCYDSPTILYYRGFADLNASKIVSVIGTRNNTDYGRQVTEQLITDLQNLNVTIVSGLAYGIDAIAHKSALQNNLPTIGVLAHGLDTIYPLQHRVLAKQMVENGGLLTEFRKETLPDKHNFPRRNRVVAGMADATIVIETAIKGGSMITAELANGYNRDVFAYPGKTTDAKSMGCNQLIQNNKAALITCAQDVIDALGWEEKKIKRKHQRELFITITDDEQILFDLLKEGDTLHIDDIFLKSGLTSSTVAASLLTLEFQNIVASLPGKMYRLV